MKAVFPRITLKGHTPESICIMLKDLKVIKSSSSLGCGMRDGIFYKTWRCVCGEQGGVLQKDHCELESVQGQEWEVHPTLGGDGIHYTFESEVQRSQTNNN